MLFFHYFKLKLLNVPQGKDLLSTQVCIQPQVSFWLKVIVRLVWESAKGYAYSSLIGMFCSIVTVSIASSKLHS